MECYTVPHSQHILSSTRTDLDRVSRGYLQRVRAARLSEEVTMMRFCLRFL